MNIQILATYNTWKTWNFVKEKEARSSTETHKQKYFFFLVHFEGEMQKWK